MDIGASDVDAGARTNIESISVVGAIGITIGVVDRDTAQREIASTVDAEDLDGRVLDIDVLNIRVNRTMGVEEFGLGLAAISSLSVPPAGTVAIEVGSGRSLDGYVRSGN